MTGTLGIIIELIPTLLICFTAIYLFHEYLRFLKERKASAKILEKQVPASASAPVVAPAPTSRNSDTLMQLKLQAAERFVLYLERISPDRLVMRLHQNGMSARMLQADMLRAIREEFDHNLSQQIYVSEGAWELIKNAKEEIMGFISATGDALKSSATGIDLSRKLFETASKVENMPHDVALKFLRAEVRKLN
jgi:hypothetical protein